MQAPRQQKRQAQTRNRRRGGVHLGLRGRLIASSVAIFLAIALWAFLARHFAPHSNTDRQHFDAIIVLGTPADADGNPTPIQLSSVTEAVHEYERGVAPRLILTGGAAHNQYVEAHVMAQAALAQGVPVTALIEEPKAHNTFENACYSEHILESHGWNSAEVIATASHLPRAALIFDRLPMEWRTHAAPQLNPDSALYDRAAEAVEIVKTMRLLTWARWSEVCAP